MTPEQIKISRTSENPKELCSFWHPEDPQDVMVPWGVQACRAPEDNVDLRDTQENG